MTIYYTIQICTVLITSNLSFTYVKFTCYMNHLLTLTNSLAADTIMGLEMPIQWCVMSLT